MHVWTPSIDGHRVGPKAIHCLAGNRPESLQRGKDTLLMSNNNLQMLQPKHRIFLKYKGRSEMSMISAYEISSHRREERVCKNVEIL